MNESCSSTSPATCAQKLFHASSRAPAMPAPMPSSVTAFALSRVCRSSQVTRIESLRTMTAYAMRKSRGSPEPRPSPPQIASSSRTGGTDAIAETIFGGAAGAQPTPGRRAARLRQLSTHTVDW